MNTDLSTASIAVVRSVNKLCNALVSNNFTMPPSRNSMYDLVPYKVQNLAHRQAPCQAFMGWLVEDAPGSLEQRLCALDCVMDLLVAQIEQVEPLFRVQLYSVVTNGYTENNGKVIEKIALHENHHRRISKDLAALAQNIGNNLDSRKIIEQATIQLESVLMLEQGLDPSKFKHKM